MNSKTFEIFGQIAGIGGLSLGLFLILFRDFIRKKIFSKLDSKQSFLIISLFLILTWAIAFVGIVSWIYISTQTISIHNKNINEIPKSYNRVISTSNFPKKILYKIEKNQVNNGKCVLSCSNHISKTKLLVMKGFNFLHYNQEEKITTYLNDDLSLSTLIVDNRNKILYETRHKQDGFDLNNQVMLVKDGTDNIIKTIDIANNYRTIDFLSSIIIVSNIISNENNIENIKLYYFNFYFNYSFRVAKLEYLGNKSIFIKGKGNNIPVSVFSLKLCTTKDEYIRYFVYKHNRDISYPVKIVIKDENGFLKLNEEKLII